LAKKTPAQRAAKKHEKEKKRKKKLAGRPLPVAPEMRWKPLEEGISGLARRMQVDRHVAASMADQLFGSGERPDASAAWLPSRVEALSTEDILDRLEALGITADAESFDALAERHWSTLRLVDTEWEPKLAAERSVHDLDFVTEAAETLWGRWKPDTHPDEWVLDAIHDAEGALDDNANDEALAMLLDAWQALGDAPIQRLERVSMSKAFTLALYDAMAMTREPSPELLEGAEILEQVAPLVTDEPDFPPEAARLLRSVQAAAQSPDAE
jgi:hypothetical protein